MFEETKQELMAFEEAASEDLQKSEKNVIGNQRKRNPYYVVSESLATVTCGESRKCG